MLYMSVENFTRCSNVLWVIDKELTFTCGKNFLKRTGVILAFNNSTMLIINIVLYIRMAALSNCLSVHPFILGRRRNEKRIS